MVHPEINLEEELNKPVSELTRKFYRDILNSMETTNVQARAILTEVQEMLVEIAGIVDSPWMHEQRGKKMRDPRSILISELIPIVRNGAINAHIEMTRIRETHRDTDYLEAENKRLTALVDRLERENVSCRDAIQSQERTISDLKRQMANDSRPQDRQQVSGKVVAELTDEKLNARYQDVLFDPDSEKIRFGYQLIGDRSKMLGPDLRQALADKYANKVKKGRVVSEIIEKIKKHNLIKIETVTKPGRRGVPPEVVSLSYYGKYCYERDTGKKYVTPEYLEEYQGTGQALLVMDAQLLLQVGGYEILEQHILQNKDGKAQFYPDITATKDGITIYIEVERDTPKDHQDADAKWRNFRHYTNGQMYMFCQGNKVKNAALRSATTAMKLPTDSLCVCDVSIARQHFKDKGTIWTAVYHGRSPD
jgi:hypothetical protein